jgi:hypothetical protein
LPGIYAWAGLRLDHTARCLAAGLFMRGRGAVSGRDAAALWGADALVRGAPIEVTVPEPIRLRAPDGLVIVRSPLAAGDIGVRAGIPVTTPVRTAFDMSRRLPIIEAVVTVDAMLAARLIGPAALAAAAAARPRWPGLAKLRRVLELCDAGAESPQETRLRLVLVAGGLPRPVCQHEVLDGTGAFVARLDLAYPHLKLGIEYEGDHHRDPSVFQRDLRRMNRLRGLGWTVLRFGAADIYREPVRVIVLVQVAYERLAPSCAG